MFFFFRTDGEAFVSAHRGDEDIGVVEDGLLMVDKKGGRKVATLMKEYDDAMPRPDDEYITLFVNNLPVTVKKNIKAKTMLTIYCQQNKLQYPDYKI